MKSEKFPHKTFNPISLYRATHSSACCYAKTLSFKVIRIDEHLEVFRELLASALYRLLKVRRFLYSFLLAERISFHGYH